MPLEAIMIELGRLIFLPLLDGWLAGWQAVNKLAMLRLITPNLSNGFEIHLLAG